MQPDNQPNKRRRQAPQAAAGVPLMEVVNKTLRRWPWILLSLAVCLGGAWLYLKRTPNSFTRSADIQLKDVGRGSSRFEGASEDFTEMGLFVPNTNLSNEINALKSKDLMGEVVRRLNLDVDYHRPGMFHNPVAYGSTLPYVVDFVSFPAEGYADFTLKVRPDGRFSISDYRLDGAEMDGAWTGQVGDTVKVPGGRLAVEPQLLAEERRAKGAKKKQGGEVTLLVSKVPVAAARDRFAYALSVGTGGKDDYTIHMAVTDQSPERADDILNSVIGVYNENWVRDRNQVAVASSNFINDRLGVIEGELGNVDNDISSYKSATLTPDVQASAGMYMAENQQLSQGIMELNNQLQMARYIRSYLTSDKSRDRLLPANTGISDMDLQSGISQYNEIVMRRNALISKSSDQNPLVLQLDAELSGLRGSIISSVDNAIVNLQSQMRSLQGAVSRTTSKLASNPGQAKYLLSVERQQKVKESLYLYLLQKREENELSQAFSAYNTRIINAPGASGLPPTPNRSRVLLMAGLVGLLLPFGVTFGLETINSKVRGRKDIKDLTIPFLGEVPLHGPAKKAKVRKDRSGEEPKLVVKPGKRDVVNEAIRVLRTNLDFMAGGKQQGQGAEVIAMTSFNPGSGKTFISMNLARAIALRDKRVLVIDGDMRRASTSAYVGNPELGLSDYLVGKEDDLQALIEHAEGTNSPDVLPVGTLPPNPTELLESPRFARLMEEARQDYDIVIVDCPPIEVVADTKIIDRQADRTIFVVRAGLMDRTMLPELEKLYEEKAYRNMAIILNGTQSDRGPLSSAYAYGTGYTYGNYAGYGHS